jgi:hypothetical protein
MIDLTILPGLLEEAAETLRTSQTLHDENFDELSYALDLALTALYRSNMTRTDSRAPALPMRAKLTLVASRETPSMRAPSAGSLA